MDINSGDIIGQVLHKRGVKFLFTLCGGHISPILTGAKKEGIRVIDVRDEVNAVFAADAVGRLTGVPGVAAVTAGPGVTNALTALKNAQMAQTPLILLGGAAPTVLKNRGALQDIDQLALVKSIVKMAVTIRRNCDVISVMEKAVDVCRSGVPGPVFIECPIDMLYGESLVRQWYGVKSDTEPGGGLRRKVLDRKIEGAGHDENGEQQAGNRVRKMPSIKADGARCGGSTRYQNYVQHRAPDC